MQKITTHEGDTLILIEIPLDAENVRCHTKFNLLSYLIDGEDFEIKLPKSNWVRIGTTSTLTNEQVEPFVEQIIYVVKPYKRNTYHSYTSEYETLNTALESWDSFLKANNIDTTKNFVVLKLLND